MIYFEHHIGDYAAAAGHLSLIEDAIYSRAQRRYYLTEAPLPADSDAVARLVGAKEPNERAAVDRVLAEFFVLQDDGWHHPGCDLVIAAYHQKIGKARNSASARWGSKPAPSDGNANAMRTHSERTPNALRTDSERNADAHRSQCDGNAPHTPHTTHQAPHKSEVGKSPATESRARPGEAGEGGGITPAAAACIAMKAAGCAKVNPSHAGLLAALAEGITPQTLGDFARAAVDAGKSDPFAYAITAARNSLAEGSGSPRAPPGQRPNRQEQIETRNRKVAQEWARGESDATA